MGESRARVRDTTVRTVADLEQHELVRGADVHSRPNTWKRKSGACAHSIAGMVWGGCAFERREGDAIFHVGVPGR